MIKNLLLFWILLLCVTTLVWKARKLPGNRQINSLSGNVNVIASQTGAIYAGTVSGVHRTTDGGSSWN